MVERTKLNILVRISSSSLSFGVLLRIIQTKPITPLIFSILQISQEVILFYKHVCLAKFSSFGGIPGPLTVEREGFLRGPFIKMNRLLFHWHRGWGIPPSHRLKFQVASFWLFVSSPLSSPRPKELESGMSWGPRIKTYC